jgi:hypothetical protein
MTNPKTKIVQYQQTVFICSCCAAESRSVYRHNEQWYCLTCLQELGKTHGIRVNSFYDPDGFIEGHRLAEQIKRIVLSKADTGRRLHCDDSGSPWRHRGIHK